MATVPGRILLNRLRKVLGLPGTVTRLVIEADIHGPARVYVRGLVDGDLVTADEIAAVVQLVNDVTVTADGEVLVEPLTTLTPAE